MKSSDKEKKFRELKPGDFVSYRIGVPGREDYGYCVSRTRVEWGKSSTEIFTNDDVETENLRICEYEDVPANYLLQLLEKLSCVSRKSDRS